MCLQETLENVKKCRNFLSTLIKLASSGKQSSETTANVKELVKNLLVNFSPLLLVLSFFHHLSPSISVLKLDRSVLIFIPFLPFLQPVFLTYVSVLARPLCLFVRQEAKIEPEDFTSRLYRELNSSPQPYLVPFLKVRSVTHQHICRCNG